MPAPPPLVMRFHPCLAVLAALAAPVASGQPVGTLPAAPDSVVRLPPFSVPIVRDFEPPHTSAVRAFAYSVVGTVGPVVLGLLANPAFPSTPEDDPLAMLGTGLIVAGVMIGPPLGNLSLGAVESVEQAGKPKVIGVTVGTGIVLVGVVATVGCALEGAGAQGACVGDPLALLTAGGAVVATGMAVGSVVDFATIPRNAERARRYRQAHPRVSAAPGWRAGRPALAVRVGL